MTFILEIRDKRGALWGFSQIGVSFMHGLLQKYLNLGF